MSKETNFKFTIGGWQILAILMFIATYGIHKFCSYFIMPVYSSKFLSSYFYVCFIATLIACSIRCLFAKSNEEYWERPIANKITGILMGLPILTFVIIFIVFIINGKMFNSEDFYNPVSKMVTVVTESSDSEEIEAIEAVAFPDLTATGTNDLPLYGIPEAANKASALLGSMPGLGSQMTIIDSEWTSQCINDELMYVAPLEPSGFIKWNKEDGNGGYFMVDRNNGETTFIQNSLYYTYDAPFSSNAYRKIYGICKNEGITELSPEIDEEGNFFYVATTYTAKKLGGFKEVTGVIALNAITGEMTRYKIGEIPEWIDRVYPETFFEDYVEYYGKYADGWLNGTFKKKGVQCMTSDFDVVYVNGQCYYYSGYTTEKNGADSDSSNGIIMMNCRTGEILLYNNYGISESKAQNVAEGKVQEKEYTASYPILLTLAEEPTYFMLMRDKSNNLTGYSFVNYRDYSKVAVADTLKEAQAAYYKVISNANTTNDLNSTIVETAKGAIVNIGSEVVDGTTMYYVRLEGQDEIFMFASNLCVEIVFAQIGDEYIIGYIPTDSSLITAVSVAKLDNLEEIKDITETPNLEPIVNENTTE